MTEIKLRLADKTIEVQSANKLLLRYGTAYMVPSETESDFIVQITPEDIEYERSMNSGGTGSETMLEYMAIYRKIAEEMIGYNTLLFHGSAICRDGHAYLFCADSGTGKSTHTKMWREVFRDQAFMINDDKPLIQINSNDVKVYGTPWSGKHHLDTNTSAPLKGISFLSRDTFNHIEPVDKENALPMLMRYCYRSRDPVRLQKELALLSSLSQTVQCYTFGCNISHEAVHVSYTGMLEGSEK